MPDLPLVVKDLTVQFPTQEGTVQAVRGINVWLRAGEVVGIVGESGSGKSVTAMSIMGLLPRSAQVTGSVQFKGRELLGLKEKQLMSVRGQGIAMIFQDPMTSLNPVYNVGWQISEAIRAHQNVTKEQALAQSVELLRKVGIPHPEARIASYPHEFSGGMRQRVVIAIAMANSPDIILADEPTTALDVTVQAQVLQSLRTALEETQAALLLITHDLGVIAGLADRIVVMYAGRTVEHGSVEDIFYRPAMPYTVGLLGSLPRLDVDGTERLRPIPGSPPSMISLSGGCPFAPRCPLRAPICNEVEPPLQVVNPAPGSTTLSGSAAPTGNGHEHDAAGPSELAMFDPHVAACHFADHVASGAAGDIFEPTSADLEIVPDP